MGIKNTTLSPHFVQRIIQDEEVPSRSNFLDQNTVQTIFRYGATVGSSIKRFEQHGRCMDHARQLIAEYEEAGKSFPSGMVLLANELTASKGRFQRYWHAPTGGLWMTLVIVNTLLPENTHFYPLLAGLACCEAVCQYQVDARIKWVNDIHVNGKKIGGILTETVIGPKYGEEYVLIGIGINVNNETFPEELAPLAISMKSLLEEEIEIDLFAARLLAKFAWNIGLLHYEERERLAIDDGTAQENLGPKLLLDQWLHLTDTIGKRVWFGFDVQKNLQYQAEVLGLDASGGLILKNLADEVITVEHSGEIIYIDNEKS